MKRGRVVKVMIIIEWTSGEKGFFFVYSSEWQSVWHCPSPHTAHQLTLMGWCSTKGYKTEETNLNHVIRWSMNFVNGHKALIEHMLNYSWPLKATSCGWANTFQGGKAIHEFAIRRKWFFCHFHLSRGIYVIWWMPSWSSFKVEHVFLRHKFTVSITTDFVALFISENYSATFVIRNEQEFRDFGAEPAANIRYTEDRCEFKWNVTCRQRL